jgi:CubicO group peptidase (beta-lactamase class C family)
VTSRAVALAIAAAGAAGALAACSHATPPTLDRPTYTRELQKLVDRDSGAAVAIVVAPEGTWKGAAGWADSSAKRRADPDDRFAIESTTKTFVATVVLQLVGEGRLDQVVTSRIIRRLYLRGTGYGTERAQRMTPWLGPVESFGRPMSGDDGIISTVEDLATLFRSLLGGNLLAPKQLAAMTRTIATTDPEQRFGLGILRHGSGCSFVWGHGGLATYAVNVAVTRDGSKAAITALHNPALGADDGGAERLYRA